MRFRNTKNIEQRRQFSLFMPLHLGLSLLAYHFVRNWLDLSPSMLRLLLLISKREVWRELFSVCVQIEQTPLNAALCYILYEIWPECEQHICKLDSMTQLQDIESREKRILFCKKCNCVHKIRSWNTCLFFIGNWKSCKLIKIWREQSIF